MNKSDLIEEHANLSWQALEATLRIYDIQYGRDYTGVQVHNGVLVISYSLEMINTTRWRRLAALGTEITQAMQLPESSNVRITFEGLDYRVEVPKPISLRNVVDLGDVFRSSKGMKVNYGVSSYDGTMIGIDFSRRPYGHVLVSGSTQCGKTNILKIIAMSLMYRNTPDQVRIAIIDTVKAQGKYGALINSAHLATGILNTEPKAIAFLTWVKDTIVKMEGKPLDKKIVILVDEMYILIGNKEARELLRYIASAGAEVGFHLIIATQYANVDDVGGKQLKGNLMTRIVGQVDDYYGSRSATGRDSMGAENLTAPGDFLSVSQDKVSRIAVPEIFDSHFGRVTRGMSPLMTLNWEENDIGTMPDVKSRPPSMAACFDRIDHRLLHLAINGKHPNGQNFGADIIRKASKVLAKRGLGDSVGNTVANEYVKFAKKLRSVK